LNRPKLLIYENLDGVCVLDIINLGRTGQWDEHSCSSAVRAAAAVFVLMLSACAGPSVSVKELADYQGQPSFEIATESATWIYHREGAGFASILDRDGVDWISYKPEGGSAGPYRGMPNLIHPENQFHPGGEDSASTLVEQTGEMARIESVTGNREWAGAWEFHPRYARFTLSKAPRPYWFLYEGTPWGALDLDHDYYMFSNGWRRPVGATWAQDLPDPEWVVFGDDRVERVLLVMQIEPDTRPDQFYQMNEEMTVFGFGREHRCCGKYLTAVPAEYAVAFLESSDYGGIRAGVEALRREMGLSY